MVNIRWKAIGARIILRYLVHMQVLSDANSSQSNVVKGICRSTMEAPELAIQVSSWVCVVGSPVG